MSTKSAKDTYVETNAPEPKDIATDALELE